MCRFSQYTGDLPVYRAVPSVLGHSVYTGFVFGANNLGTDFILRVFVVPGVCFSRVGGHVGMGLDRYFEVYVFRL